MLSNRTTGTRFTQVAALLAKPSKAVAKEITLLRAPSRQMQSVWSWNALVDRKMRGETLVEHRVFARKLGPQALSVWRLLIRWRDKNGLAWPSKRGLVRHTTLSIASAKRAMSKLKRLRLVEDAGYMQRNGKRLWHYEVRGEPADGKCSSVWVPQAAMDAIKACRAHGGKRRGAGRPKSSRTPVYSSRTPSITLNLPPSSSRKEIGARADTRKEDLMDTDVVGTGQGSALRQRFDEWMATGIERGLIPTNPRNIGVCAIRVPPPARIDKAKSVLDKVNLLLSCYRGAVRSRTGKKSGVFLRGGVQNSRYWKALCAAVQALEEHDIPPAAWAAWSVDVWFRKEDKKPPPLTWVWGAKRITSRRGWFRSDSGDFSTTRLLWTAKAKMAVQIWDAFSRVLWTEFTDDDSARTADIVDSALGSLMNVPPSDAVAAWRDLVTDAQREIDDGKRRLAGVSADGEVWLW